MMHSSVSFVKLIITHSFVHVEMFDGNITSSSFCPSTTSTGRPLISHYHLSFCDNLKVICKNKYIQAIK